MLEKIKHDELFVAYEVSLLFFEIGFCFIYLEEYDLLLACQRYELPTPENDYLRIFGFNANFYRDLKEITNDIVKKFNKRIIEDMKEYVLKTKTFLIIKAELSPEKLRILSNIKKSI